MATWLVYPFLLLPYLLDLIPAQDPDDPFAMHFDESFRTCIRTIFSSPDAPNEEAQDQQHGKDENDGDWERWERRARKLGAHLKQNGGSKRQKADKRGNSDHETASGCTAILRLWLTKSIGSSQLEALCRKRLLRSWRWCRLICLKHSTFPSLSSEMMR